MTSFTTSRMFNLYRILASSRQRKTSADLAARLEVSAKTIERNINYLRGLNLPIYAGHHPRPGYWLAVKKCPCCGQSK